MQPRYTAIDITLGSNTFALMPDLKPPGETLRPLGWGVTTGPLKHYDLEVFVRLVVVMHLGLNTLRPLRTCGDEQYFRQPRSLLPINS
jgi:hypothetical protein